VKYLFAQTPIEHYSVLGRQVFVKRDDLFGVHPAPPLGKLRGLEILLQRYHEQSVPVIGCWDTRVSKLGQGLAALVRGFAGMRAIVSYPIRKGCVVPKPVKIAASLGADVVPIRGNHVSICYAQITKLVTERGGIMLPFGLDCHESVAAVAQEAATVPVDLLKSGTVVLCCGSGVTLAGLLLGLPALPRRFVGISSGRSVAKILACVSRYVPQLPRSVELHPATVPYDCALEFSCPFPSHPNYDLKAWKFLADNIDSLRDPVFFWNVGA
jgi:1-aminocyclopropane-1-carboxylate deaminase/D-cysteine desulfhydrase-like pyridoxal-dependent ACC family enzyme